MLQPVQGAAQVHPSPALGHADHPLIQGPGELAYWIIVITAAVRAQQMIARTAHRAGDGLVMEAPGVRVPVLPGAFRAHMERPHGGLLPVVGQVLDHREAGPAVGAVGEGVQVPAVPGVEHLPQAALANRGVVGDAHPPGPGLAGDDGEPHPPKLVVGKSPGNLHGVQTGQGRQGLPEPGHELPGVPVDLNDHVGAVVLHIAAQAHGPGQAVDRRPETHPLDHSPHGYAHAPFHHAPAIYPLSVHTRGE
ncbi:MAG: hypothetical protein A4E29_01073 [Methanomassiliicoccales archaeon PtaB.Bin134]|nr:MAG: hypothetical protein A4E29_01073 [Methanomassiliicoccales archaeon PtaB.Bin134]